MEENNDMKQSASISAKHIIWAVIITFVPVILGVIMGIELFVK